MIISRNLEKNISSKKDKSVVYDKIKLQPTRKQNQEN